MTKSPLRSPSFSITDLERFALGWILDCEYRQLSQCTVDGRRSFVKNLLWWFRREEHKTCGPCEIRSFLNYVAKELNGRWGNPHCHGPASSRTVRDYYTTLQVMFRWATSEGYLEQNPMAGLRPPVHRPDQVQPFTEQQIKSLVSAAKHSDHAKRDQAIVLFLLDTGVRNSELCTLTLRDVDMVNKKAIVLGKGNKHRAVYFGRDTSRVLWQSLRSRTTQPSDPLFTSERGRALTRSGLLQLIKRLGTVARVEAVRCSPHTFRHTCAVWFLRNGGQVFALRELLGHTDLGMTNRYVALAQADVQDQHRRFSPVERLRNSRP